MMHVSEETDWEVEEEGSGTLTCRLGESREVSKRGGGEEMHHVMGSDKKRELQRSGLRDELR